MHSNVLFPGKNLPLGITIILRNKILLRNLWWKKFHRTFFPVEELCLHKMPNSNSTTNVQNSSNCTRILYPLKWKDICPWFYPQIGILAKFLPQQVNSSMRKPFSFNSFYLQVLSESHKFSNKMTKWKKIGNMFFTIWTWPNWPIGAKILLRFQFEGKTDVWISQIRCAM